jgi:hypothetical protein
MKRILLSAASGIALVLSGTPAFAQEGAGQPEGEQLAQVSEMFAGLFTSEPLTPEQEARLPAAMALIDVMLPEGFYAAMMGEMMGTMLDPMMAMMSGATGADLMLAGRLNVDPQVKEALSDEQKVELATLLDPAFAQRGPLMQGMMNDIMLQAAVAIEPGFREGMAKAYAVRFDSAQIDDIAAFFATPTGAVYARENIKLMADPQVMSASMQAMPAMMEQFGGLASELEAAMAQLPAERGVGDLSQQERTRAAQLLGVDADALDEAINPPAAASNTGSGAE